MKPGESSSSWMVWRVSRKWRCSRPLSSTSIQGKNWSPGTGLASSLITTGVVQLLPELVDLVKYTSRFEPLGRTLVVSG